MAVDLLRSCYQTKMRFWADSDISIDVRWYFCQPESKVFPGYTVLASGNWAKDKLTWEGPGEVLGAPRTWVDGSPPPWAMGSCFNLDYYWPDLVYMQVTDIHPGFLALPISVGDVFVLSNFGGTNPNWYHSGIPSPNPFSAFLVMSVGCSAVGPPTEHTVLFMNGVGVSYWIIQEKVGMIAGTHFDGPEDTWLGRGVYPGVGLGGDDFGYQPACGPIAWTCTTNAFGFEYYGFDNQDTVSFRLTLSPP